MVLGSTSGKGRALQLRQQWNVPDTTTCLWLSFPNLIANIWRSSFLRHDEIKITVCCQLTPLPLLPMQTPPVLKGTIGLQCCCTSSYTSYGMVRLMEGCIPAVAMDTSYDITGSNDQRYIITIMATGPFVELGLCRHYLQCV